jgi:hypothetical protein
MLSAFIVECMKEDAKAELQSYDEKTLENIWQAINHAFEEWKMKNGNRTPIKKAIGLLDEDKEIAFEDAKPWECANFFNPSRISLTFKLLSEGNEDLNLILKTFPEAHILALLIDKEPQSYSNDDMFIAYQTMIKKQASKRGSYATILHYLPSIKAGEAQKKNLAKGNAVASQNKTSRANEYHQDWIKWAIETWKAHPYWELDRVANHVLAIAQAHNHKMSNGKVYAASTIMQKIKGVKSSLKEEN